MSELFDQQPPILAAEDDVLRQPQQDANVTGHDDVTDTADHEALRTDELSAGVTGADRRNGQNKSGTLGSLLINSHGDYYDF